MISLLFGLIIGFSLGLTGGGGSIFAVPLLVYGLAMPVHEAVGVSLVAVSATALGGAIIRLRRREVELKAALLFGMAGIVGAPLGAVLGAKLPAKFLLGGFALLMLLVAARMWLQAVRRPAEAGIVRAGDDALDATSGPACRINPAGGLTLTSRCTVVLILSGVFTGFLSGLFGVGGGFLIVPALVLVASLPMQRAVPTSLLIIAIISAAGSASYLLAGRPLALEVTALWFILGGLGGMVLGGRLSRRLAGPCLQKLFATAMAGVAIYMLIPIPGRF